MKILVYYLIIFHLIITLVKTDIVYNETEAGLQLVEAITVNDEIVLRMIKKINGSDCLDPKVRLRHVQRDGNIKHVDVNFPFPETYLCDDYSFLAQFFPDSMLMFYEKDASHYVLLAELDGKIIRLLFAIYINQTFISNNLLTFC